jgi:aryl-alcohol dehydrogenase-like predicted oxidoreductase
VTPWSVIGAGVLSGKYNDPASQATGRAKEGAAKIDRNIAIAKEASAIASELGASSTQVAISWVRQQKGVVIPLLGARNLEQLRDNLGTLAVTLSADQLERLDKASAIEPGFPHDFLSTDGIRNLAYGGTFDLIDNHRVR